MLQRAERSYRGVSVPVSDEPAEHPLRTQLEQRAVLRTTTGRALRTYAGTRAYTSVVGLLRTGKKTTGVRASALGS